MGAVELQSARTGFIVNFSSTDASLGEDALGPDASKSHFITSVTIACVSAITVQIHNTGGPDLILIGPFPFSASSVPVTINYQDPINMGAIEPIHVTSSGAGEVCVIIQGYTE